MVIQMVTLDSKHRTNRKQRKHKKTTKLRPQRVSGKGRRR